MRLPAVVVAVASVLASALPAFAQSLEVRGGSVRIEVAHVDAVVEEGVARVEVDETFRNLTAAVQEGVYTFRLPEDAVIGSFSMWMQGKEKQGRVLEARQARAVYDSIVSKRRDPGLLEQTGWREFRVSVFPIPANDTVRVRLRYAHVVRDDLGLETIEVPLPAGAGAVGDLRVRAVMNAAHGFTGADCPSHAGAKLKFDANGAEATWSGDGVVPTGPFVMRAIAKRDGFGVSLLAHRPPGATDGWFVARVVPRLASPPSIPRDVVFVIDRSGSMEGRKMEQARAALLRGLDTLKPGDRFGVVSFASDVTSVGDGGLLPADADHLAAAGRAAADLTPTGGTNISGALDAALALRSDDAKRLFAVVFLTDGDPTVGERDPNRILAAWRSKSAGAARLYAFGVGSDVKDFLLTKLATEGRGDARYVREDENLEVKLAALFERVRTPLLLDPSVEVEGDGVTILDREPRRLPDLFQQRALVVAGRYKGAGKATIRLRGRSGAADVSLDIPVDLPAQTPDRPHVAQIWAKARVERLLDDIRVGGPNVELRDEVLRLGLTHQLVTPYTSFLVVEDGVRIPGAGDSARVPEPAPPEIVDHAAVPQFTESQAEGPVNPDEVVIPDAVPGRDGYADTGEYNPDPESPATGGTSIGVGHGGSGQPSSFSGRGGGGLGQGGAGSAADATKGAGPREQAVQSRAPWLASHQRPDGRWSVSDTPTADDVRAPGDVGATGLALLAFLGAGETHQSGSQRQTVRNGLRFLRDIQDSEGCIGSRTCPRFVRDHALAALALTETYGLTGSRVFKEPAQRSVAFALSQRSPDGLWHGAAAAGDAFDAETTGWMLLLLQSARMAGFEVDSEATNSALAALDRLTDPATGRTANDDVATAVAVLSRILAGRAPASQPLDAKGVDAFAAIAPSWAAKSSRDLAASYFAAVAAFQVGDATWRKWNDSMKVTLAARQIQDRSSDAYGSWNPPAGVGRAEATALSILALEVYWRYPVIGTRR
jgi:Ca-activated chloride channel family protein